MTRFALSSIVMFVPLALITLPIGCAMGDARALALLGALTRALS